MPGRGANVGNVNIGIELDDSKLKTQIKSVSYDIDRAVASAGKGAKGRIEAMASSMGTLGLQMAAALSLPLMAAGKQAVQLASDYRDAVAKVFTISDSSAIGDSQLSRELLDLSTATGRSASEIADAAYQALSASVDTEHVVGFVGDAVKLAKAGFLDTAGAVDVLTTIINAYGMSAEDAEKISGRLVATQNLGKTTVNELASSMGQVIPTAAAYNVGLDDLSSAYVILTKQGINTANATTMLNGMMTELAKDGTDVSKILKEKTGKTFGQLMSDGKNLGEVLQILNDSVGGNSEAFANLWGEVRASKGALAIANAGTAEYNDAMAAMEQSTGLVGEALEKLDTPSAKAQRAMNAFNNTLILIGDEILGALEPALSALAQGAQAVYKWFSELDEGTKHLIIGLAGVTAGVGALYGVMKAGQSIAQFTGMFGAAGKGAEGLVGQLGKLTKAGGVATKALSLTRAGLIGIGIAAGVVAVAAIADLIKQYERHRKSSTALRDALKENRGALNETADSVGKAEGKYYDIAAAVERVVERHEKMAEVIAERNSELQTGVAEIDRYRDKITDLDGTMDEVKGSELAAVVAELNDKFGTSYSVLKDAAGAYHVVGDDAAYAKDEILKLLDAQDLQLRYEATVETRKELFKERTDMEEGLAKARNTLKEAETELADLEEEAAAAPFWQDYDPLIDAKREQVDELRTSYEKLKQQRDDVVAADEANWQTEVYIARAIDDSSNALAGLIARNGEAMSSFEQTGHTAFDFEKALDDLGIGFEELSQLSDDELAEVAANFNGYASSISETLARLKAEAEQRGSDMGEGLAAGIRKNISTVMSASSELVNAALNAADATAKRGSPWKTTIERGEDAAEGLAVGIGNGTQDAVSAARSMVSSVLSAAQVGDALQNIMWDGARAANPLQLPSSATSSPMGFRADRQKDGARIVIESMTVNSNTPEEWMIDVVARMNALGAM